MCFAHFRHYPVFFRVFPYLSAKKQFYFWIFFNIFFNFTEFYQIIPCFFEFRVFPWVGIAPTFSVFPWVGIARPWVSSHFRDYRGCPDKTCARKFFRVISVHNFSLFFTYFRVLRSAFENLRGQFKKMCDSTSSRTPPEIRERTSEDNGNGFLWVLGVSTYFLIVIIYLGNIYSCRKNRACVY